MRYLLAYATLTIVSLVLLAACARPAVRPTATAPSGATQAPTATGAVTASDSSPTLVVGTATAIPTSAPAPTTPPTQPISATAAAATIVPTQAPTATAGPTDPPASSAPIAFRLVTDGLNQPVYALPGGPDRLLVVEKPGVVRVVVAGKIADQPFLDIKDRVGSSGSEQGLLSIALHPQYATNGYVYVDYTNTDGDTVIARFTAQDGQADPGSELKLLTIKQPYQNHNGGLVLFGPDGYLYIGMGDGGSAGDPQNRAQNLDELLGKILRIDVDSDSPYGIPADNPFAQGGGKPEIWAYGLRNPWRFSFDRVTGDLLIGDVGQNLYEEIDFQPAGVGGRNYGWHQAEANHCYTDGCTLGDFIGPIVEYPHTSGCSVTGGYVYHGSAIPTLAGQYLYGDYCTGRVWALTHTGDTWTNAELLDTDIKISSFGQDASGELYVLDSDAGKLYQMIGNG